jgi:hypothetical protein
MSAVPFKTPVEDSVGKVNNEIAVGEDLEFQRKWWKFEKIVWVVFTIMVILDVIGLFGRGPLAHAKKQTADGSMVLKYDRIARYSSPSNLSVQFGPAAVHDNKIELLMSQDVISELGAQRISPQPTSSVLDGGKMLYTFPATPGAAAMVQIAFQSSKPGMHHVEFQVPGSEPLHASVFVMP